MEILGVTQSLLIWALLLGSVALKGFALVHALTVRPQAFVAAGKLQKWIWGAILGVAMAVQIIQLYPLGILNLLGVVAATVYLVDVRPAVAAVGGGRGGRGRRGPSTEGPYGPW